MMEGVPVSTCRVEEMIQFMSLKSRMKLVAKYQSEKRYVRENLGKSRAEKQEECRRWEGMVLG